MSLSKYDDNDMDLFSDSEDSMDIDLASDRITYHLKKYTWEIPPLKTSLQHCNTNTEIEKAIQLWFSHALFVIGCDIIMFDKTNIPYHYFIYMKTTIKLYKVIHYSITNRGNNNDFVDYLMREFTKHYDWLKKVGYTELNDNQLQQAKRYNRNLPRSLVQVIETFMNYNKYCHDICVKHLPTLVKYYKLIDGDKVEEVTLPLINYNQST